jgi:cytochrome b involved in lipid metabolism
LPVANSGQPVVLTLTEIALHNNQSNCWIIVSNNVYDVTSALGNHPGGASTIVSYCGKEATGAFQTKNIGNNHSSSAYSWLNQLKLGSVGQTVNQTSVQNAQSITPVSNIDD